MLKDRIKEAIIPAFITLAVFMGVLLAKGIFPFGDLRIDYYDMGQTNAPLYYHIWDFLHGRGGLFYSWYIDEGQNLSIVTFVADASLSVSGISPFSICFSSS